jgi:hypothetical protein
MKRRRFVELHRRAIKWPESRFQYIGVDFLDPAGREKGWQGEVCIDLSIMSPLY